MSMGLYILDDAGNPVPCEDIAVWGEWFETPQKRRVAGDEIGGYRVSTVFLGIDHSFGAGPAVLWETMVFGDGAWSDWTERYTSRAVAEAGHKRIVAAIARGQAPSS